MNQAIRDKVLFRTAPQVQDADGEANVAPRPADDEPIDGTDDLVRAHGMKAARAPEPFVSESMAAGPSASRY